MSLKLRKTNIKRVLKNVIKRAFGELNNVFRGEFNKILSQQSTNVRWGGGGVYWEELQRGLNFEPQVE